MKKNLKWKQAASVIVAAAMLIQGGTFVMASDPSAEQQAIDAAAESEAAARAAAESEAARIAAEQAAAESEAARLAAESEAARIAAEQAAAESEAARIAAEQAAAESEAKAKAESEAESEAKAKAESEAEAKAKAESEAKAKAESEAQSEVQARAESEAKAQSEAQAKAESEAQSEAQARAESEARAQSEAQARAESEAQAQSEAQTSAQDGIMQIGNMVPLEPSVTDENALLYRVTFDEHAEDHGTVRVENKEIELETYYAEVEENGTFTFTVEADQGYEVDSAKIENKEIPETKNEDEYEVKDIVKNVEIVITYIEDTEPNSTLPNGNTAAGPEIGNGTETNSTEAGTGTPETTETEFSFNFAQVHLEPGEEAWLTGAEGEKHSWDLLNENVLSIESQDGALVNVKAVAEGEIFLAHTYAVADTTTMETFHVVVGDPAGNEVPAEVETELTTEAAEPETEPTTEAAESETELTTEETEPETELTTEAAEPETELTTEATEPETELTTEAAEPETELATETELMTESETEIKSETELESELETELESETESESELPAAQLQYENNEVSVSVTVTGNIELPENTEVRVETLTSGAEYEEAKAIAEASGDFSPEATYTVYNVTLVADGEELDIPEECLSVQLHLKANETENLTVFQLEGASAQDVTAQMLEGGMPATDGNETGMTADNSAAAAGDTETGDSADAMNE